MEIFLQAEKSSKVMEIIFASSKNIDLTFYMLEKAQKHGFGSEKKFKKHEYNFCKLKDF